MNRRDFLCMRTEPRGPTLELSCQRLYMQCVDARLGGLSTADETIGADDPLSGEPPAVYDRRTARELFDEIDRELQAVDTLRVLDRQWLAGAEIAHDLEESMSRFRARGGRVEFSVSSS